MSLVRRKAPRAAGLALGCVVSGGLVAGCIPQTGDFGRAERGVIPDTLMPFAGAAFARQRGEPVSAYRLTDDETGMRDLAWGVVMPPLDGQWRQLALVELRRTRILPANRVRLDKASYVETLIAQPYRSSGARYARLKADVDADILRVEPFFQAAARVADGDRARDRALARAPELRPDERANAEARIAENGLMIAWVRESFDERLVAYRYALDRLMLETPDRAALSVQAAIATLDRVLASLAPLGAPRGVFKG